jgi:hypothetical protein
MIFKEGEKVVCIDSEFEGESTLELYKIYTVESCVSFNFRDVWIEGIFIDGIGGVFCGERFITIEEFRKLKINDILK